MLKELKGPYFIVCGYTDLRRGIDGLAGIIQQNYNLDACSGGLFLFCGRRCDRIKALLWEGDGFLLLYKRLDNGKFQWPRNKTEAEQITAEQYTWLMQGLSIEQQIEAYIKALKAENSKFQNENSELQNENTALKNQVEKQELQINNLTEMLVNSRKKIFGKSSEKSKYFNDAQMSLFNEAEVCAEPTAPEPEKETLIAAHKRHRKRTKAEITENLQHIKQVCDLENKECEICGGELTCIGEEFVRSELNIIPAQMYIVDIYRKVYKCTHCSDDELTSIFKADTPISVMKGSMATPASVAYVMQQKYQLGIPLTRQSKYLKELGAEIGSNTLANWVIKSSRWFEKLWQRMHDLRLKESVIHADETPLRVLNRNGKPTDSESRMWVFCSGKDSAHKMALYYHHATRAGQVVTDMIGDYSGYLQTDGYSAYNAAVNAVRIGCWAHARRKFTDCLPKGIKTEDARAGKALELIGKIFAADEGLVELTSKQRYEKRQEILKPVLDEYWDFVESIYAASGSNLAKAVTYSLNQKKHLNNVLLNGELELTNNRAERAVKPFVIGRKNWLFSDTDKGADASARCYSIIESANLNDLNVFGYLSYLLTELLKLGDEPTDEQLDYLMPWSETLPRYCKNV